MQKGLENHTVSLTKNGYFKLRDLINRYPASQLVNHLGEFSLNEAQSIQMLGGDENVKNIPKVWDAVKSQAQAAQYALLAISIVFSHKDLIQLFANETHADGKGKIRRASFPTEKTYTNLAYALNELGIAVNFRSGADSFWYDWKRVFPMDIGSLVKRVLIAQLERMGWREPGDDDPFTRPFCEQAEAYNFHRVFGLSDQLFEDWLEGKSIILPDSAFKTVSPMTDFSEFFEDLNKAMQDASLQYNPFLQQRFVAALLTKPFLILSGLSGSGKTKLAQAFAQWICEDSSQIAIIPVGADWINRDPLLGYPDALKPGFYSPPENGVLHLIQEAGMGINADKPYFLILDEMNLSHVERYFADFLSAMESREGIRLRPDDENWKDNTPSKLSFPPNLFIVGTVNVDETTYMFSPKVLDRANVIEFRVSPEEMGAFLKDQRSLDMSKLTFAGSKYSAGFVQAAVLGPADQGDNDLLQQTLLHFFNELQVVGAEFGYRTASEIFRFAGVMAKFPPLGETPLTAETIIDAAILQKLLPKVHGSRIKVEPALKALAGLCLRDKANLNKMINASWEVEWDAERIRFPLSLTKIVNMGKRIVHNGFTSYTEA